MAARHAANAVQYYYEAVRRHTTYHGAQGWEHETPGYPVQHLASHQAGDGEGGQEGDQDSGDASQECRQEQEPLWQEFSLISEMDLVHK